MKGQKTGGRQKGSLNRTTLQVRNYYLELINSNLETIQDDLNTLEPLQRIKIIIELSKFVLPTLKATDLTINDESSILPFDVSNLWKQELQ